jgi:hypothetical protein
VPNRRGLGVEDLSHVRVAKVIVILERPCLAMSAQAAEQMGYSRSERALPGASRRIPPPALEMMGRVRPGVTF